MIFRAAIVPPYFALRVGCGLVLLKLATSWLPASGFNLFAQFGLFAALISFICGGALQNGLVRAIAGAAGDRRALGRIHAAAARLSSGCCVLIVLTTLAAASRISIVLVGEPSHARAILVLTAICLLGTPGQLWCGLLTGEGRVLASLLCQGCGLVLGTAAAALRLAHGDPVGASQGLAAGACATSIFAGLALRPWRLPCALARPDPADLTTLARFALAVGGAFALGSGAMFVLRYLYREATGDIALSHWLAASRISDVSTQLVGLMMAQVVLPELARARAPRTKRAVLLHGAAFGGSVSGLALLAFLLGAGPLVSTFLSPMYLAAVPAIALYLAGDVLRSAVSLAQQVNLAEGRLGRYAALELGLPAIMAVALGALLQGSPGLAPEVAYCLANGLLAGAVLWGLLRRRGYRHARRSAETV